MSYKEWGNATWYLFHGLAHKLKPEYNDFSKELITCFYNICNNLPCDYCSNHAMHVMKKCNIQNINTKEKLKDIIWQLHNIVNIRLKKPILTKEERDELYNKINTKNIIYNFKLVMNKNHRIEKAMMGSFKRQQYLKYFNKFINENIDKFDN